MSDRDKNMITLMKLISAETTSAFNKIQCLHALLKYEPNPQNIYYGFALSELRKIRDNPDLDASTRRLAIDEIENFSIKEK